MPSTQHAANNHEYRSVPVTALVASASNPRKRFDEKSLEELAASFKTQGVLAPLLDVRYDRARGLMQGSLDKLARSTTSDCQPDLLQP